MSSSSRLCKAPRATSDPTVATMWLPSLLGGSGVVISGVISPRVWVISIVTLLITLLISTHEPPSTTTA